MKKRHAKKDWWQSVFDDKYLKTYVDIVTPELTRKQVDFLVKSLKLNKKQKILDLACGYGRHSLELVRRGYNVTGFDYSNYFLKQAKSIAKKEKLNVEFIQGDFRKLPFRNEFDAVINMFTSFGYFDQAKENRKVLTSIYKALKPHGLAIIDLNNPVATIARINTLPNARQEKGVLHASSVSSLSNGLEVKTEHHVNITKMMWLMNRAWTENGARKKYVTNIKMYTLQELSKLITSIGFNIQKVLGNFSGEPFTTSSRRMIFLIKK